MTWTANGTGRGGSRGGWGGRVCAWPRAAPIPPRPIPNRVVPGASAGEYCAGDRVGGEAAARTPDPRSRGAVVAPDPVRPRPAARGGAVAARWAHNPKVAGSNPAPATSKTRPPGTLSQAVFCALNRGSEGTNPSGAPGRSPWRAPGTPAPPPSAGSRRGAAPRVGYGSWSTTVGVPQRSQGHHP